MKTRYASPGRWTISQAARIGGYPVSRRRRRINLHSPGFQFASTAANSNDNTGSERIRDVPRAEEPGQEGERVQRMQIPDYKLKLSLEGGEGLWPRARRTRSWPGVCFVLENLNSNPRRGRSLAVTSVCVCVCTAMVRGVYASRKVVCKWASFLWNKGGTGWDLCAWWVSRFLFFFFFFFELEPLRGRDPIFSGIINIRNVDFSIKKCNFSHIEIILIGWKNLCYPISKYRSLLCLINTHETILILNLSSFVWLNSISQIYCYERMDMSRTIKINKNIIILLLSQSLRKGKVDKIVDNQDEKKKTWKFIPRVTH